MAIAFARGRHLQRSKGHSAGRSIAYEHGRRITLERTGTTYDFSRRTDVAFAQILLPPGADPRLADPSALANAMENRERRRDSQLGYQVVLALPKELSRDEMIELLRDAAREYFVERGAAVSIALHPPHEGEANWHGHLTGTRRRVEGAELVGDVQYNGPVRTWKGRRNAYDPNYLGQWWAEYQNAWFEARGLDLRVDPPNPLGQTHLGPERFRDDDARALAEEERKAIVVACHEPRAVLDALTRNSPTFDAEDLARLLVKNVRAEAVEFVSRKTLAHPDVIALVDPETGLSTGRYTTRQVREREEAILAAADEAARRRYGSLGARPDHAAERHGLKPEQRAALDHCADAGGLALITGDPGTGKSRTLAAVRDAFEGAGDRVVFLAPTNVVAEAGRRDGFAEAGTVHSALWRFDHAGELPPHARVRPWDRGTVVVVDEAAMLASTTLLDLMGRVNEAGAKLILCGDDKQLSSVEAGGMFGVLVRTYGSSRLEEIRRQEIDWQRWASAAMARGEFVDALRRYQFEDRIGWHEDEASTVAALVETWAEDSAARPERSRLCLASTNALVDALNAGCRAVRRERGELGPDVWIETDRGPMAVAVGERLLVTATAKRLGLANGQLGTVTRIEGTTVVLRVGERPEEWRELAVPTERFTGLRHGYASTVHKAQGATIDETYVLVTKHARRNAGFVAATRHRHDCHWFVSRQVARSVEGLAALVARSEGREASVTWAPGSEAEWLRRRAVRIAAGASIDREAAHSEAVEEPDRARWWRRLGAVVSEWIGEQPTVPEAVLRDPVERDRWVRESPDFKARVTSAHREFDAELEAERAPAAPVDWSSAVARNQALLAEVNAPTSDVTPTPVVPLPLGRPALPGEVPALLPSGEPATVAAPPEIVTGAVAVTTRVWWPEITVTDPATGRAVATVKGGAGTGKTPIVTTTVRDLAPGTYHIAARGVRGRLIAEGRALVVAGQTTALDLSKSTSTADDFTRGQGGPDRGGPML